MAEIQVESINIDSPTIKLRRSLDGSGNWNFEPAENIRNSRLLDQVKLDQITLSSGTLQLADDRRSAYAELKKINATFSALNLAGPWRSSGIFDYGDGAPGVYGKYRHMGRMMNLWAWGFAFLPGRIPATPISSMAKAMLAQFDGTLRLDPTQSADGKSDTEGQFRPVTFKSKVTGSFEKIALSEIEIRPAGVAEQGTILSGNANFILDKQIKATADFSAPAGGF